MTDTLADPLVEKVEANMRHADRAAAADPDEPQRRPAVGVRRQSIDAFGTVARCTRCHVEITGLPPAAVARQARAHVADTGHGVVVEAELVTLRYVATWAAD